MTALTREDWDRLDKRIEKARTNFEMFIRLVLGFKHAHHQNEWVEACQEIGDNPEGQRVCIIAAPGAGKSSLVVAGFVSWMIGRYPYMHFGLISFADKPALERATTVRNIIETSSIYRQIFPEIMPDFTAWDKASFRVRRENVADLHPTLRSAGARSSVVSYRFHGLVIDDPHDPKNVGTPTARKKVWDNYVDAIATRLVKNAWQLVISTRWSDDDFVGCLLRQQYKKKKLWKVIHTPALDSRGRSYWPEEYPTELLKEKEYNEPASFAIQYMGDTTGGSTQIIRKLGVYEEEPEEILKTKDLMLASGWDTCLKKGEENDFNVGFTAGLDQHGVIWVIDQLKGRWGVPELARQMIESYEKFKQFTVWIEDTAAGTPAIDTVMEEAPIVPTEPVPVSGDKISRANSLAGWIHGGHILFPEKATWFNETKHILTHFPYVDHDDEVDALFVLCKKLLEQRHPAMYLQERQRVRLQMR